MRETYISVGGFAVLQNAAQDTIFEICEKFPSSIQVHGLSSKYARIRHREIASTLRNEFVWLRKKFTGRTHTPPLLPRTRPRPLQLGKREVGEKLSIKRTTPGENCAGRGGKWGVFNGGFGNIKLRKLIFKSVQILAYFRVRCCRMSFAELLKKNKKKKLFRVLNNKWQVNAKSNESFMVSFFFLLNGDRAIVFGLYAAVEKSNQRIYLGEKREWEKKHITIIIFIELYITLHLIQNTWSSIHILSPPLWYFIHTFRLRAKHWK